jgi:DNA uptake protein ComE-like DNA-binding protein
MPKKECETQKKNLNRVKLDDLAALDGFDTELADYLLRCRPFKSWKQVAALEDIDEALLRTLQKAATLTFPDANREDGF